MQSHRFDLVACSGTRHWRDCRPCGECPDFAHAGHVSRNLRDSSSLRLDLHHDEALGVLCEFGDGFDTSASFLNSGDQQGVGQGGGVTEIGSGRRRHGHGHAGSTAAPLLPTPQEEAVRSLAALKTRRGIEKASAGNARTAWPMIRHDMEFDEGCVGNFSR